MSAHQMELVCSWDKYRFWKLAGLYCVTKGTEEQPHPNRFRYSSLLYLLNAKRVPNDARPKKVIQ